VSSCDPANGEEHRVKGPTVVLQGVNIRAEGLSIDELFNLNQNQPEKAIINR
jgi:hypothetical protein